jgi:hypothetical protein
MICLRAAPSPRCNAACFVWFFFDARHSSEMRTLLTTVLVLSVSCGAREMATTAHANHAPLVRVAGHSKKSAQQQVVTYFFDKLAIVTLEIVMPVIVTLAIVCLLLPHLLLPLCNQLVSIAHFCFRFVFQHINL